MQVPCARPNGERTASSSRTELPFPYQSKHCQPPPLSDATSHATSRAAKLLRLLGRQELTTWGGARRRCRWHRWRLVLRWRLHAHAAVAAMIHRREREAIDSGQGRRPKRRAGLMRMVSVGARAHIRRCGGLRHHARQDDLQAFNHGQQHAADCGGAPGGTPAAAGGEDATGRPTRDDRVPRILLFSDGHQRAVERRKQPTPHRKVPWARQQNTGATNMCSSESWGRDVPTGEACEMCTTQRDGGGMCRASARTADDWHPGPHSCHTAEEPLSTR